MNSELNGISPISLVKKTQFQCRVTPALSALSVAAETEKGSNGSLCSRSLDVAALVRLGSQA